MKYYSRVLEIHTDPAAPGIRRRAVMTTLHEQQMKKASKDVIVSEMIDYLTDNQIIRSAANKALELMIDECVGDLLKKKFTERVWDNMPQIDGEFDFSDSDESKARDELMRIQNIIDRATSNELDVRNVGQVYK